MSITYEGNSENTLGTAITKRVEVLPGSKFAARHLRLLPFSGLSKTHLLFWVAICGKMQQTF